ncbi:MAG: cupin domain-containing protein [Terracidiphilus sp.]|jgi:mannose-6-phosphate isomerase-like protein (cupin superfamily)
MDRLSKEILKELLPAEREAVPRPASKQALRQNHLDHWSPAILLERAAYLRKLAKQGDGSASETLREYPRHCAMLLFRSRNGVVEVHENFADLFCVLEGRATLLTGGTVAGLETIAPGEMRGVSMEGGARLELRAGDVAHVPAGLPHQMLVPGDKTVTCMVIKIQENP